MIQGVIFDLWETLIYNELLPAVKPTLESTGLPYDEWKKVERKISVKELDGISGTMEAIVEELGNGYGLKRLMPLQRYFQARPKYSTLYQETLDTLAELKRRNLKLALLSNVSTLFKDSFYEFRLEKYFDAVLFSCECGMVKPQKEFYELAARRLELPHNELIMVGDNLNADVIPPTELGIKGILVDRKNVQEYSPKIRSLDEIVKYLE